MDTEMKHFKIIITYLVIFILSTGLNSFASSIAKRIEEKIGPEEDAPLQERIDGIGQKIVSVCDKKSIPYTFKVLKGDEVNAFTLPNGEVYVFKGLIDRTKTDDELAAVLGHEIGHVVANHHEERSRRSILTSIFKIVAITGAETSKDRYMINNALNELTLSYSQQEELEADKLSTIYLKRAGYNPEAVISMLDILKKYEMGGPIKPKRRWKTHPYIHERIRASREEISGRISFNDYINTPTQGIER